jgi:hypothetical protein
MRASATRARRPSCWRPGRVSTRTRASFSYSDGPAGRKVITDPNDADAKALVRSGTVRFLYAEDKGGLVTVSYVIPRM